MMKVREAEIKKALTNRIMAQRNGSPNYFLEELRINGGEIRADLVDASEMHCYEIKSDGDTLIRLIRQGAQYSKIFDKVTIVTADCHLEKVIETVPSWWGILLVKKNRGDLLKQIRVAKSNKRNLSAEDLATLFNKDEALDLLDKISTSKGWKSKSLYKIQEHIAKTLPLEDLKTYAKDNLIKRVHL